MITIVEKTKNGRECTTTRRTVLEGAWEGRGTKTTSCKKMHNKNEKEYDI